MPTQVPIDDGLFTWPSAEPRLIGGRCRACGTVTFPRQGSCPRCTGRAVDEHLLDRRGTLWTFTVQGFEPKPPYTGPAPFEPYGVGYVDLGGEVLVESRLTEHDPERLRIGAPMELVVVPFRHDDDGAEVVTFAFRPVDGPGRE
ncbi:MAG TPA: OB-fold domain-containing protein [Acidimicrobiales bacterium]